MKQSHEKQNYKHGGGGFHYYLIGEYEKTEKHIAQNQHLTQGISTTYYEDISKGRSYSDAPGNNLSSLKVSVSNKPSLVAAKSIYNQSGATPVVLNFANQEEPGGGYKKGAKAQEESIVRESNFSAAFPLISQHYQSTSTKRGIGDTGTIFIGKDKSKANGGLYYIKEQTRKRDHKGNKIFKILPKPVPFNMLISAAPDLHKKSNKQKMTAEEYAEKVYHQIINQLRTAADNGQRDLVLGAWGCGVFKNSPKVIAELYKLALSQDEFSGKFNSVTFANPGSGQYKVFDQVFKNPNVSSLADIKTYIKKDSHYQGLLSATHKKHLANLDHPSFATHAEMLLQLRGEMDRGAAPGDFFGKGLSIDWADKKKSFGCRDFYFNDPNSAALHLYQLTGFLNKNNIGFTLLKANNGNSASGVRLNDEQWNQLASLLKSSAPKNERFSCSHADLFNSIKKLDNHFSLSDFNFLNKAVHQGKLIIDNAASANKTYHGDHVISFKGNSTNSRKEIKRLKQKLKDYGISKGLWKCDKNGKLDPKGQYRAIKLHPAEAYKLNKVLQLDHRLQKLINSKNANQIVGLGLRPAPSSQFFPKYLPSPMARYIQKLIAKDPRRAESLLTALEKGNQNEFYAALDKNGLTISKRCPANNNLQNNNNAALLNNNQP